MSEMGVVHRNLKPESILMCSGLSLQPYLHIHTVPDTYVYLKPSHLCL